MRGHTLDRIPNMVKVDFYRIEKHALEQLAPTDEQARIKLVKLNKYFRTWQEEMIKKHALAAQQAALQNAVERRLDDNDQCDEPATDDPQPAPKRRSKRTSDEGRRERDSDGERSPPKRRRVEPKRSSDVKPSVAKKQNKRRVFFGKSGQRKELPDREVDGVDAPEASPGAGAVVVKEEPGVEEEAVVKVETGVKEETSEESPRTSRTCPICGKQYRASSSYFYHMKYFHKRSREHECSVCNKKFGTKANLAQHASIHTGAYDLECKECGKRFKSKPSLYIHEQSHGGPKRWVCSQCGRSFRWRTHMARHMTRHAAERAHVCGTCGRGFSVRCDLLRHARTHAAAEYHCATCGVKFAQKRYLQVHVMKKHREPPAPVVTRS